MMNLKRKFDLCIIIPAYNAKETIKNTLESIKIQELPISFEVIIVNDCSNYNYNKYINQYKKYYNIRELETKVNSGPGVARQLGIDSSDSKYIVFIDSDDTFYDKNSVLNMYKQIENTDSDLIVSNFLYQKGNKKCVRKRDFNWLHGKIYRRDFINKNNIRFNNTRANEDNGFNRLVQFLSPKFLFLDEVVYCYNDNPNSITRNAENKYIFTGLKGFCYNMNWAIEGAVSRGVPEKNFIHIVLDILTALYVYYIGLYNEFNVEKIIDWGNDLFFVYNKYKNCINENEIKAVLDSKKKMLGDIYTEEYCKISFEEFLKKFKS